MKKKDELIIMKVWKSKLKNQKMITIPKDCDIQDGDYVKVEKIKKK